MGRIRWSDIAGASYPASNASPRTILNSISGKLDTFGTTTPADGSTGFAKGCTFKNTADGKLYTNAGSSTSSSFVDGAAVAGTAAGRGPSPAIWSDCPVLDFNLDPTKGWVFFDDFIKKNLVLASAATVTIIGDWACCTDGTGGSTLDPQTDAREGEVNITTTTDNEDIIMSALNGMHNTGQVTFEAGKKTWFEARVKVDNVTDTKINTFIGFAEEGLVVNGTLLTVTNAIVDKDYIAFTQLAADGNAWQTTHNTASGGGSSVLSATAGVITINTYHKLGIYCDGTTIFFYIDGVLLADSVALTTANVPDGEEMAFYFSIMAASGDTISASIDWVRVAQEF